MLDIDKSNHLHINTFVATWSSEYGSQVFKEKVDRVKSKL